MLCSYKIGDCEIVLQHGSILEFEGDAIVNAANEGCVGGFGVDEAINKAGGFQLKQARKDLGGCKTGNAKITESFEHTKVKWIIHAVGPVYRIPFGLNIDDEQSFLSSKDDLLYLAYKNSLERAKENNIKEIGFCLLCAGVFRGKRDLKDILQIGLKSITENIYNGLTKIVIYAFTDEEKTILHQVGEEYFTK